MNKRKPCKTAWVLNLGIAFCLLASASVMARAQQAPPSLVENFLGVCQADGRTAFGRWG